MEAPDISRLQVKDDGKNQTDEPAILKIKQLLKAKDDTAKFLGLTLLKSVLDNVPDVEDDKETIVSLWNSVSPTFLDRLLRPNPRSTSEQKKYKDKDMFDIGVAVIRAFAVLLPDDAKRDTKLISRIPKLAEAVLYSSEKTTQIIIETILTLITIHEGAKAFANLDVDDWTPLIEITPEHSHIFTIFVWAWIKGTAGLKDGQAREAMRAKIDGGIQALVSSFIKTDATSLLDFISHILRNLNENLIPRSPKWLGSVTKLIRNLATNRPNAASRSAYTNCAAALLLVYPESAPRQLFFDEKKSSKSFSYLFINLITVDLRATLPSLLSKLNDPNYPLISQRLTSALNILTVFISQLIGWMEELDNSKPGKALEYSWLKMPPELVLKLSSSIGQTLSVVIEYLRDRWDASVAGAQGLHPNARTGSAHTDFGSHKTLAWDTKDGNAATDSFVLSAIRAIALWVRDDDGDVLREEAADLMDMFMELYQSNSLTPTHLSGLDYRLSILASLEGILRTARGMEAFNERNGWKTLAVDMLEILQLSSTRNLLPEADILRGSRIALVLQIVAASEESTPEDWMSIVTGVAAYDVPNRSGDPKIESLLDFQMDVLQLTAMLVENASPGMKKRYRHSIEAIQGIITLLRSCAESGSDTAKELEEVYSTLGSNSKRS
ncbi:DUF1941-domain-containing protein [Jackrogersella minutella]|nr:DUF1941-domain-containing protein [Jackrogersella minutella]